MLIVGASFAGLYCQRALSDEFDVTLVDRKDYYEYTPGVLRVLAHPRHLRNIVGPLPRTRNRFLHAEVLEAGPSHVRVRHATTGGEETLGFDFLLLGCGSSYAAPIKPAAADATLDARERTWDAAAAPPPPRSRRSSSAAGRWASSSRPSSPSATCTRR